MATVTIVLDIDLDIREVAAAKSLPAATTEKVREVIEDDLAQALRGVPYAAAIRAVVARWP